MDKNMLCALAKEVMKNSYSLYSSFCVGAALLSKSGKVFLGTNVENASFGETVCAERVAFFKAVSEGEREFSAIAIVGGKAGEISEFCLPCFSCRQVMREFCKDDFEIVLQNGNGEIKTFDLKTLAPHPFSNLE